jgi:hypothetical protein
MRARQRLLRALVTDVVADVDEVTPEIIVAWWHYASANQLVNWRRELLAKKPPAAVESVCSRTRKLGFAKLSWTPKMRQVAKVEPCP